MHKIFEDLFFKKKIWLCKTTYFLISWEKNLQNSNLLSCFKLCIVESSYGVEVVQFFVLPLAKFQPQVIILDYKFA